MLADFSSETYEGYMSDCILEIQAFGRQAFLRKKNGNRLFEVSFTAAMAIAESNTIERFRYKRPSGFYRIRDK